MLSLAPWLAAGLVGAAMLVWPTRQAPWRWTQGNTARRAGGRSRGREPGVADAMDHLALALSGGAGVQPALHEVARVTPGLAGQELAVVATALAAGLDEEAAWSQAPARWQPARRAMTLASLAGVAPASLLRAAAEDLRRDTLARVDQATARLSVQLVLPLGLAFLPAFVLISVVPFVVALASSLADAW